MIIRLLSYATWVLLPFTTLLHYIGADFAAPSVAIAAIIGILSLTSGSAKNTFYNKKISRNYIALIGALFVSVSFLPLVDSAIITSSDYYISTLTLAIGLCSFFGYTHTLQNNFQSSVRGMQHGFIIFVSISSLELMSIVGVLPNSIKYIINTALSGQSSSALQGTTFEPSAAARMIAFYIALILIFKFTRIYLKWMIAILIVLLASTLSLTGILAGAVGALFTLKSKSKIKLAKTSLLIICVLSVGKFTISTIGTSFFSNSHSFSRYGKISNSVDIASDLLYLDGSVALRTLSQAVAVNISLSHPLGVGAGQFNHYFQEFSYDLFDPVLNLPEVRKHYYLGQSNPQSMPARFLSEGGWVSFLIFSYILVKILSKTRLPQEYNFIIGVLLVTLMQTASYVFAPVWAGLSVIIFCKNYYKIK